MIKFFRNIRQNLLMENKTGKYFKYAVGEILLVMVGILLALQVNNWNTERLNRQTEKNYYCQLVIDFESDKTDLLKLIEASKQRVKVTKQLLVDLDAKTKTKEELILGLFTSLRSDAFIPSKSTIIDLTSSGRLSLIKDKALRKEIFKYYEDLDNKAEIAKSNREVNAENILKWDNILELGWQEFSLLEINEETLQTFPNLDWHLDKGNPYYIRFQEVLVISLGVNWREQQLYNLILTDMEPIMKQLNLACIDN
jgi:hypothetical protein